MSEEISSEQSYLAPGELSAAVERMIEVALRGALESMASEGGDA
jgi:hypothetical protein